MLSSAPKITNSVDGDSNAPRRSGVGNVAQCAILSSCAARKAVRVNRLKSAMRFLADKTRGNLSRKPRWQSFVESKMHEHVAGNRRGKCAGQQQTLLESGRAMQAMLGMKKLDIAALKRAAS